MKVKSLFFLFLILISVRVVGQENTAVYEEWREHMVLAEEAIKAKNTGEAATQYMAAKRIVDDELYDHSAYVITMDRIISEHYIFEAIAPLETLLDNVRKRIDFVYGSEHSFAKSFRNNTEYSAIASLEKTLSDVYYTLLGELYESSDKTSIDTKVMVKELMLKEYIFSNYEYICYYAFYWFNLEDPEFQNHIKVAFEGNYYYAEQLEIAEKVEESLLPLENAFHFMDSDEDLKKAYGIEVTERVFFGNIDLERYEEAIAYKNYFETLYNEEYGENSKELAFMYNELAVAYELLNEAEYADIYYQQAILVFLISGELEHEYYKSIRDNYILFLTKRNENDKLLEFFKEESDAYDREEIRNENYFLSLKQYNILIHYDRAYENIEIENLEKIIEYCVNRNQLADVYIKSVIQLGTIFRYNDSRIKLFDLMTENRHGLIAAQKTSSYTEGEFYKVLALNFSTESAKDEQEIKRLEHRLIADIDKAIYYFESHNTDYGEYAVLLNMKGVSLCFLGQMAEGIDLLKENKINLEKYELTQTDNYSTVLGLLAFNSSADGDDEDGDALLRRSIEVYNQSGDTLSPNYFSASQEYIRFLIRKDERLEAERLILKNYNYIIDGLETQLRNKSSNAREFKLDRGALSFLSELQYYNYLLKDDTDVLFDIAIEAALLTKNLTLSVSSNIINKLRDFHDKSMDLLIEMYQTQTYLSSKKIDILRRQNTNEDLVTIKAQEEEIDEAYANVISYYLEKFDDPLLNLSDFREMKLVSNEVYVDFVRAINLEGQFTYMAYIYSSGGEKPSIINLGLEDDLEEILSSGDVQHLNYDARGSISKRSTSDFMGKELYDMVWAPIDGLVGSRDIIYFSLAGILNKIPIASLQNSSGEILMDRFELVQVSSSAPLFSKEEVVPNMSELVIYGGINYDMIPELELEQRFSYLPGTMKEVTSIGHIIPEAAIYSAKEADENSFRNLDGKSSSVLHLATHGFYFDYDSAPESSFGKIFKMDKNPLKRTGLLLANGNEGINGVANKRFNEGADGVLTSLEIALLDLRETDLVVLSACETGLGDIDGNEGVYGLQRAFKMAGVDMIMMSLWEIPDEETQEYMIKFYSLCLNNSVRSAFRSTQQYMKDRYKDRPEIWAAFVLVE